MTVGKLGLDSDNSINMIVHLEIINDFSAARGSNHHHITIQANDRDQKRESGDASGLKSRYQGDYSDRDLKPISANDLGYWAWQISRGMEYLGRRKVGDYFKQMTK